MVPNNWFDLLDLQEVQVLPCFQESANVKCENGNSNKILGVFNGVPQEVGGEHRKDREDQ